MDTHGEARYPFHLQESGRGPSRAIAAKALAALAFLSWFAVGGTARAETAPKLYVGLLGGVSAPTDDVEPNPYGVGLGARVGLRLPLSDIYVGGAFLYHLGSSELSEVSANTLMVSAEAGYEWSLGPIALRPSLGAGFASQSVDLDVAGIGSIGGSQDSFFLSPGVNVMLDVLILLGAEVRYNALFAEDSLNSVSVLATLGFTI